MHLVFRIVVWVLATLIVLTTGTYVYLRNADLSIYREQIEERLSEAIGQEVRIDGSFDLDFGNLTRVTAEQITLSNPNWQPEPAIVSIGHFSATVDLWSLAFGPIIVDSLEIQDATVRLERNDRSEANWDRTDVQPDKQQDGNFDPELIAFREIRMQGIQLTYLDPSRKTPLFIALDHLRLKPDENNVLDLDVSATVNDIPLSADGKLGPWTNLLHGKNVSADLDLLLGKVSLAIHGSVADLSQLEGIEASFNLDGPAIDRVIGTLGFAPFAEGKFKLEGNMQRLDYGSQFKLEGNLGAIDIFASGDIDMLIRPGRAELDFSFSGPDTKYVAEVFGIEGAAAAPFHVSGKMDMEGSRYTFSDIELQFAAGDIDIDGWIDLHDSIPNGDMTISGSGPDFSVIGPFADIEGLPAEFFKIDGRVQKDRANWYFDDFVLQVGENLFGVNGKFDTSDATSNQIDITATGPDISFLQPMVGLQGLPAWPYDVAVRVKPHRSGLLLEKATGVFGDNSIDLNGVIGTKPGLAGTDIEFLVEGPELINVALLTGIPYLPNGVFSIGGRVMIDDDDLQLESVHASTGEISASANGKISLESDPVNFDLGVSVSGANLSKLMPFELESVPATPFSLSGQVSGTPTGFSVEKIVIIIGNSNIDGDLTVIFDARPKLKGVFSSTFLDLTEQLPQTAATITGTYEPEKKFLLSNEPLATDWLDFANIDLSLTADRLKLRQADVLDFQIGLRLADGTLDIEPVSFRESEGRVFGNVHLRPVDGVYVFDAALDVENVHLGLLAYENQDRATLPALTGRLELNGTGNSLHQLMASSNGALSLNQGAGRLKDVMGSRLLGDVILEVFRALIPAREEELYTTLECAIYQVDFENGLATIENLAIQTDKMTIVVEGTVNFENEILDLEVRVKPREGLGISVGGFANSLLRLGGTLQNPQPRLDPAGTGVAVATGGLSIIAKGLWDSVTSRRDICKDREK
jgi:uncharacterized protein involved in outer membrane biogenesis